MVIKLPKLPESPNSTGSLMKTEKGINVQHMLPGIATKSHFNRSGREVPSNSVQMLKHTF